MIPTASPACYAVIVAGGSGTRMKSVLPKQFLLLNGRPVILHTINAFLASRSQPQLLVVLPEAYHEYWRELCLTHQFTFAHTLIKGGETRFHSVKNAIDTIKDAEALVAVHDAVRPMVDPEIIDACYQQAAQAGNAIAAVKSRDSIRQMHQGTTRSLIRDEVYLVQTPQTFTLSQLREAYTLSYTDAFTDDASVVEQAGHVIHLAESNYQNFKITYPEDIWIAEILLQKKGLS